MVLRQQSKYLSKQVLQLCKGAMLVSTFQYFVIKTEFKDVILWTSPLYASGIG